MPKNCKNCNKLMYNFPVQELCFDCWRQEQINLGKSVVTITEPTELKKHFCWQCLSSFFLPEDVLPYINARNETICDLCYHDRRLPVREGFLPMKKAYEEIPSMYPQFFEPEHYHKHELDTITFLQKGFKPEVFMGFAIGHVIKYAQRAEYKNGREDFVKMVDYAKRALDWYDKQTKDLGE